MRLETLLAVTGGRLLNAPAISRFESVALRPEKVERGTLYITRDPDTIPAALQRGAYGILCSRMCQPTDDESAWIVVPDYQKALVGILRAWLAEHPRRFIHLPYIPFQLAKELARHAPLRWLDGDLTQISETILRSGPDEKLIAWDETLLERLGTDVHTPSYRPYEGTVVKSSLFEISAIINGEYHEKINLSPCLFADFLEALGFLDIFGPVTLPKSLRPIPSFDPIFVSRCGKIVSEGASDRVVILVDRQTPCRCFMLLQRIGWSCVNALFPKDFKTSCDIKAPVVFYEYDEEAIEKLLELLEKPGFYPLAGIQRAKLEAYLARRRHEPIQKGLF